MPTTSESDQQKSGEGGESAPQLQANPSHADDRSSQTSKQKKLGKYGFRLSPEEQETAYELKAIMFRKLEEQNASVDSEIQFHQSIKEAQARRSKSARAYQNQVEMSRPNAIKLMKLYEKQAVKGNNRIKELEKELTDSQAIAKRYHDMYVKDKEQQAKQGKQNESKQKSKHNKEPAENSSRDADTDKENKKSSARVTDADLDDDEAVYKRHVLRVIDTKSMKDTAPIRVQDIIRKNEVLLVENEKFRLEIKRLKWDNSQLIKKSKDAVEEKNKVMHTVGTSEFARVDLSKRLERERRDHQRLQRSLTRQAAEWVQIRKEMQEQDESRRWTTVAQISPFDSEARTYLHSSKKNTDLPRQMYAVQGSNR